MSRQSSSLTKSQVLLSLAAIETEVKAMSTPTPGTCDQIQTTKLVERARDVTDYIILQGITSEEITHSNHNDTLIVLETVCERLKSTTSQSYARQKYTTLLHKLACEYIELQEMEQQADT